MLAVIVLSATLRLAAPDGACTGTAACGAGAAPLSASLPVYREETIALVRNAHRLTATLALLACIGLLAVSLTSRPRPLQLVLLSSGLLAVALGLAALGVVTPGSRSPWVLLGNLLGGFAMLALAWRITRLSGTDAGKVAGRRGVAGLEGWTCASALLWGLQAALGALAGTERYLGAEIAHVLLALVVAPISFVLGVRVWQWGPRREGTALMAIAVLQWTLGQVVVRAGVPIAVLLAHNLVAALGLALLIGLIGRVPARAPGPGVR